MNARQCLLLIAILAAGPMPAARADEAEDQYAVAAGHYDRQQWTLAAEEFRVFLEKHSEHAQAGNSTFFLGMAHVQLREYKTARTQFQACQERKPDGRKAIEAEFRVGEMSYFLDDRGAARRDLVAFRENHPDDSLNAYAVPYLADVALKTKLYVEAEALYREALKTYPTGPKQDHCRFGLAQALEAQGKKEEPTLLYTALSAKNGPLVEQALYFLGKRQYSDGNRAAAIASFEELENKHPASRYRQPARLGKACALFRDKRQDDAQVIFESLADDAQLGAEARLWLGAIHKARRDWERAAATMLVAARREPDHPRCAELLFHVADSCRMAGRHAEAVKLFDEVLARWPKHALAADCQLGKLRTAATAGNHEQIAAIAGRIEQDFRGTPVHQEAQRRVVRSLLDQGKAAAALEALEPLHNEKSAAHRWEVQQLLAEAYFQLQQNDRAEAAIEPLLHETAPTDVRAEAQYTLGRLLAAAKRWDKAIGPLEGFVATQPKGEQAAHCRGDLLVAYAKTGQVEKALAAHADLVASHAEQPKIVSLATLHLADALYETKHYPESGTLYRALATEARYEELAADGWSGLGWSQYQSGLLPLATESFAKLLKDHPKHALAGDAALARAQVLEELQKKEEAIAAYELVIEQYGAGQPGGGRASGLPGRQDAGPTLATALLGAAQLHGQVGRHAKAAELYQRLLKEFPDFAQKDAVLYQLAWALHDGGQAAEAEKAFRRLYAEQRGSRFWGDATFRTANAAFADGRHEEAGRLSEELLASRPQADVLAHALLLQGRVAAAQEKWTAAIRPLERLVKEFPESTLRPAAEYYLAESSYQQGRHEEAARRFAELAPRLAGQTEKWVAMVPLRQAQSLAQLQKWTEAQRIAEGIAAAHPNFEAQYEADYVLGRCLAGQAMFDEARTAYERVVSSTTGGKTETAAMAQWMIGETYFHQKEYRTALKEYLRVEILYAYPKWQAAALLQAGKCCEQLGHWSLAAKYFERVVNEFGNTEFKAEGEKRLRSAQQRQRSTP